MQVRRTDGRANTSASVTDVFMRTWHKISVWLAHVVVRQWSRAIDLSSAADCCLASTLTTGRSRTLSLVMSDNVVQKISLSLLPQNTLRQNPLLYALFPYLIIVHHFYFSSRVYISLAQFSPFDIVFVLFLFHMCEQPNAICPLLALYAFCPNKAQKVDVFS